MKHVLCGDVATESMGVGAIARAAPGSHRLIERLSPGFD
jgi:hypothetical protein